MPKVGILPPLRKVFSTPARYKIIYGGRGSGKSFSTAVHLIELTSRYKLKVLCIRQYQNNIKESVYTLLKDVIYAQGLEKEFEIQQATIKHRETKSEFVFFGVARNFEEIKSFEGADILYSEESHALTKEQWAVIDPTIRKEHSECYLVFNPRHRNDFVWQNFVEHKRKDSIVVKINYDENPHLSQTMLSVIAEAKEEDEDAYRHVYLGEPHEGDDRALFTFGEVEQATDGNFNDVSNEGIFSYGLDVGRYGNDKSVLTKRKGMRIYFLKEFAKYNTMELATSVTREIDEESKIVDGVFVDTIGVGAGVFDRMKDLGQKTIEANVSMKAEEVDIYHNKRAEAYFGLRDFVRRGGKLPNDKDLREELLAITYEYSSTSGKIIISPKDKIKELLGRSPDKSDSVMLHFFTKIKPRALKRDTFIRQSGGGWMGA